MNVIQHQTAHVSTSARENMFKRVMLRALLNTLFCDTYVSVIFIKLAAIGSPLYLFWLVMESYKPNIGTVLE